MYQCHLQMDDVLVGILYVQVPLEQSRPFPWPAPSTDSDSLDIRSMVAVGVEYLLEHCYAVDDLVMAAAAVVVVVFVELHLDHSSTGNYRQFHQASSENFAAEISH